MTFDGVDDAGERRELVGYARMIWLSRDYREGTRGSWGTKGYVVEAIDC